MAPQSETRVSARPQALQTAGRVTAIDGMRALAMLMVYVYHTWEFAGAPALRVGELSIGAIINGFPAGVDLFMVLSGFCLFWPLAKNPSLAAQWETGDFARRRARRILPPYLGSILFVTLLPNFFVCIFKLSHLPAKWQHFPSLWQYVTHLTFTHTLFPGTWDGIQGVYWSLGLEAQLYVAFPLVVWLFRKMGIAVLIPMVLTSLVYRIIGAAILRDAGWRPNFLFSITFLGRWMEFAAGMLAAWIVAKRRNSLLSGFAGSALCGSAILTYSVAVSHLVPNLGRFPLREVLLSFAFGSGAVAVCASRSLLRRALEHRALVFLGVISYSIFLLHQNMMFYFGELLKKVLHLNAGARLGLLLTVGFAITVAISYAFFRIFERPFLSARAKSSTRDSALDARGAQPVVEVIRPRFPARDAVA